MLNYLYVIYESVFDLSCMLFNVVAALLEKLDVLKSAGTYNMNH